MKKFLTIVVLVAALATGRAQTCDTLFNLTSNLDTATVLAADTGVAGGYLAGNNQYGDLAKAEAFAVPDSGYYMISATFYFGVVTINPTDTNNTVTLYAWDNTGISLTGTGAPGNAFDSTQVTLGQIAQAVTANEGLLVYFTGVALTTDTIFVGVVLPTAAGDTLALLTNSVPSGPDGNGWELGQNPNLSGPVWSTYNNDWGVTSGSLGNYIKIGICNSPPSTDPSAYFGAVNNSASLCSPVIISFFDSTSSVPAPDGWVWSFGDGTYSNIQNPTHIYTAGGAYVVTESVTNNTGSVIQVFVSFTDVITLLSTPSISAAVTPADTFYNPTGSATISVSDGSGHYFATWTDSGTVVATGDTLAGVLPGTYVVTIVDQNGCGTSDTVAITAIVGPAGLIRLNSSQQVKVYPNPATDVLNLDWSQKTNAEISILDMNGNVLRTIFNSADMTTVVDIHDLAAGTYILRITDRTITKQASMLFTKL